MNSIRTRLFLLSVFSSITLCNVRAQNVGINASGTAANLSAILDLDGVTGFTGPNGYKGLLIPRMTSAQRTGIVTLPAAAQGLVVYQTDGVQGFYYNTSITTTPAWAYLSASGTNWLLTGNSGTTASTAAIGSAANNNFIGTTDAKDFVIATNDLERMRFASGGNIGIGVAPSAFTHINGAYTSAFGGLFASQGIYYIATSTNSISNNNNHTGAQFQGQGASSSKVKNLYGVEGDAFMGHTTATGLSTGQVVGVYGTASAISGIASTNVGEVYGVLGMPQFFDPLNATNTAGVASELFVFAGTETNASLFKGICNAGDISAGTITNLYGINIPVLSKTGGTVTTAYGAWIENPTAGTSNYGAYFGGNVGIGATTPAQALDVYSKFQVSSTGDIVKINNVTTTWPTSNSTGVLTNNGSGMLTWTAAAAASATCWSLTGNAGTTASASAIGSAVNNDFIGTTDAKDFVLAANNLERMRISSGGNIGIGTITPTSTALVTINPTTNALRNGIDMNMTGATSTATGLNITAGAASVNGITVTHSSGSTSASLYGIGAVLSSTNIVSGYNGYRNGSGLSYGIYAINGTNASYATNANTWAAFLQGRTVISSESSPTSPLGTDLEVRNTTTGAAAPATVSLRQTNVITTSGTTLTNLNFGDNNVTSPQAQIQVTRGAASSSAADLPTDMVFYTTPDASATLTERMRIANTGFVGIGGITPAQALDVFNKFEVNSSGDIVKINNVTTTWPTSNSAGVLTNNGSGTLTWAAASGGSGWALTGNAGTDGGATNFIGTTDAKALSIRVNNFKSGLIDITSSGAVFPNSSDGCTFFGYQSGKNIAAGTNISSTGVGFEALTALGNFGTHNSAFGNAALSANSDGFSNTAIGSKSMASNVSGGQNTAVGVNSLFTNAGDGSVTGLGNTAVGFQSLYFNASGNYNTAVGFQAYMSNTFTNSMVLGADPTGVINPTASNMVNIGDHSVTSIKGQVAFTTYSDGRIKDNVQENVPGLAFIKELRPVTYNYDYNKELEICGGKKTADWNGKYDIEKIKFSGFIAQEVEAAAKKVGYNFSGVDKPKSEKDLYGLRYSDFVVPLVKSVQELNTENEDLKAKVEVLTADNKEIKAELDKIKSLLESNKK